MFSASCRSVSSASCSFSFLPHVDQCLYRGRCLLPYAGRCLPTLTSQYPVYQRKRVCTGMCALVYIQIFVLWRIGSDLLATVGNAQVLSRSAICSEFRSLSSVVIPMCPEICLLFKVPVTVLFSLICSTLVQKPAACSEFRLLSCFLPVIPLWSRDFPAGQHNTGAL